MEAEYGRHFLANYQCAAPMWPADVQPRPEQQEVVKDHDPGEARGGPTRAAPLISSAQSAKLPPPPALELHPQVVLSTPGSISSAESGAAGPGDTAFQPSRFGGAVEAPPATGGTPDGAWGGGRTNGGTGSTQASLPGSVPLATEHGAGSLTLKEVDRQVQASLDSFFADEASWQQVMHEVAHSMKLRSLDTAPNKLVPGKKGTFRVQVPKPYPGVQYRRSKDLKDKFPRYAKHGSTIVGEVEEDREWLRVRGGSLYLPLRIGPVQILQPMPEPRSEATGLDRGADAGSRKAGEDTAKECCWTCSGAAAGQPNREAVVVTKVR